MRGLSALQIQRETGLSYKSALFMMHRIRWAMTELLEQLGQNGEIVEFDECYIGGRPRRIPGKDATKGPAFDFSKRMTPVVGGVERGGNVRMRVVENVTREVLPHHLRAIVDRSAHLMTDERQAYGPIGKAYANHGTVHHKSGEYVRDGVSTNTIEGVWAA